MPKPEKFEVIMERRSSWFFLQNLPKELFEFTMQEGGQLNRNEFTLASYVNDGWHRRLELIYTKETFDYVPVRQVGLHRYRDLRYIKRDKDVFAKNITQVLPRLLEEITPDYLPRSGHMLKSKGILDWNFPDTLPEKIGSFVKFIGPRHPLDFINNSTVILDYVDFAGGNELVFLYNRVRNEFFAENKKAFIPNTIHDFDALKLETLESLIKEKLESYLLKLESSGNEMRHSVDRPW